MSINKLIDYHSFKDFVCKNFLKNPFFIITVIFQIVFFWPILTQEIINDHTWPQGMFHPTPTYLHEGRWFGEIIYILLGNQGTQKIQILISIFLKSVNLIFFLKLFDFKSNVFYFLAAFGFLIFPTVLDQYSFHTAITMTVIETFALAGFYLMKHKYSIIIPILLFSFALSTYQPVISLIMLIPICFEIMRSTRESTIDWHFIINVITAIIFSSLISELASRFFYNYFNLTPRFQGFDWPVVWRECNNAIVNFYRFIRYSFYTNTFKAMEYFPLLFTLLFYGLSFFKSLKKWYTTFLLILIPFVLYSVFILSSGRASSEGRSYFAFSYFFLFVIPFISMLINKFTKLILILPLSIIVLFLTINMQQITNYLTYKNLFETNYLNRVVSKIEDSINTDHKYKLVILGKMPEYSTFNHIKYTNYLPHITRPFFQPYRQVLILNYWLGYQVFTKPDDIDISKIQPEISKLKPYPNQNCFSIIDDIFIMKLSDENVNTWTIQREKNWIKE